jgi:hypothetical protein
MKVSKYRKWDEISNEYFDNISKHQLYADALKAGIRLSPKASDKDDLDERKVKTVKVSRSVPGLTGYSILTKAPIPDEPVVLLEQSKGIPAKILSEGIKRRVIHGKEAPVVWRAQTENE